MKIGAHISIAGGIEKASFNAKALNCECFQMFSRSPRGGNYKKIKKDQAEKFRQNCRENGFDIGRDYIIHTPYFINLASINSRIYYGSIKTLREELEIASLLRAPFVITHLGSARDIKEKKEINLKVMKALEKIHQGYVGSAMLVLEIAAGSGEIIGDTLEEIGYFIKQGEKKGISLGFCFDTCHAFSAGYDLRKPVGARKVFKDIEKKIGQGKLKCIHFNDSQADFNSHIDRHEHIGQGKIGAVGLKVVAKIAYELNLNLYLETKHDKIEEDLKLVKGWRRSF